MFCFPLTLTHGSSVCIRVHFEFSHKRKFDFMRVVYYTFVVIFTLIIIVMMSCLLVELHLCIIFFLRLSVQVVICNGTFYNICEEAAFTVFKG